MKSDPWALQRSSAALMLIFSLAGCAGLTSQKVADPNQLEGVAYFMPMKYFTLTVTKAGGQVTTVEWSESAAFPDLSRAYSLNYTPHLIGKTSVAVEVAPNGLLGSANTSTTDSNAELTKITPKILGMKAQFRSAGEGCAEDGSFVFMFPSPERATGLVCGNVAVNIQRAPIDGQIDKTDLDSPKHPKADEKVPGSKTDTTDPDSPTRLKAHGKVPGIFYRLNRPYIATASAPGVFQTKLLFTPNESPNYFLPYGRTLFAANDGKIELTEGVLKKYTQANDGELVALLNAPASVLSAYFTAVGNVFTAFQAKDLNKITRLENDLKMDALQRKLDKCKAAAKANDDATWASQQCDAIGSDG